MDAVVDSAAGTSFSFLRAIMPWLVLSDIFSRELVSCEWAMRNIKITIAYDGSDFHGWQFQPGIPTVQGAIADVARKITQERIVVHGASRTDTGVHALGQVAHFKTSSALSSPEFLRSLNALLPPTIRIVAAEEVGHDFHARWLAQGKTYRYRIFRGKVLPPFEYGRVLHYPWPLDENQMAAAARLFEGEHDFTSFAASAGSEEHDRDRSMVRVLYSSEILCEPAREEISLLSPREIVLALHGAQNRRHSDRSRARQTHSQRHSCGIRVARPFPLRPYGSSRRPLPLLYHSNIPTPPTPSPPFPPALLAAP